VLTITEIGADRLDDLRDLWLALHRYHVEIGSTPLVEDETASWRSRRAWYERWLRDGEAFVLLAEREGEPVGYAVIHIQEGSYDTFPLGDHFAEIYSLSVMPDARGQGIGNQLLDAIDERLAAMGITAVAVAAMVENEAALRLYERRGFVPREILLYRLPWPE
jgi:ribosomal protein S18 acetylase RimI-like enzyme